MADEAAIRARLEQNYAAFEGIMSLTPAKYYYGEDNDDQWQRKKQTKEEKKAAKRAKLDPDSHKSALDVHREKERKRKRELDGDREEATAELEGTTTAPEAPAKRQKKQKINDEGAAPPKILTPEEDEVMRRDKANKRRERRERKKEKRRTKIDAREIKKTKARELLQTSSKSSNAASTTTLLAEPEDHSSSEAADVDVAEATPHINGTDSKESRTIFPVPATVAGKPTEDEFEGDEKIRVEGFGDEQKSDIEDESSSASASNFDTPTFDGSAQHSSASSSSSIVPPSDLVLDDTKMQSVKSPAMEFSTNTLNQPVEEKSQSPADVSPSAETSQKASKLPHIDPEKLKERLEARLKAMRAARKADGPDGRPARNRQDLIDARRQKEERRRQHKKEIRAQARKDKDHNEAEAEAARLRGGSGSPLWSTPSLLSPKETSNSFSFGRVAFADGEEMDTSLTSTLDPRTKKGPQDAKTALEAARKKRERLGGLDEQKRKDIEEKDRWLNAKKRVQGEKIRDNTSLLKKTLKRQEKGKKKSEKEWNDRIEGVQKGKEMRQKKREDNLQKRKDDKGGKKGSKPAPKSKKRPGFEGSFKTGPKRGA